MKLRWTQMNTCLARARLQLALMMHQEGGEAVEGALCLCRVMPAGRRCRQPGGSGAPSPPLRRACARRAGAMSRARAGALCSSTASVWTHELW